MMKLLIQEFQRVQPLYYRQEKRLPVRFGIIQPEMQDVGFVYKTGNNLLFSRVKYNAYAYNENQ